MVRIHFNDTALRHIAAHRAPDREGRLLHRTSNRAYRERWFRLTGNLLFYFRTNDVGGLADATDPLGVMVLAACHVTMEEFGDRPFVFSVLFDGEEGHKHFFSGQSQQQCRQWVGAVRGCAYSVLQTQLLSLRRQITTLSGTDPLLARFKVPSRSCTVPLSSAAATTFYVGLPSANQTSTVDPIVPTRQAPSRPAPLVQLLEPTADSQLASVQHTTTATFSDWKTFH